MRKGVVISASLCLSAFTCLALLTVCGATGRFNALTYGWINGLTSPEVTAVMLVISGMGEWYVYLAVSVLLLVIPGTRFKSGLPSLTVLVTALAATFLLKQLFQIDRPEVLAPASEIGYGFPSGHALYGTAFMGFCCRLLIRSLQRVSLKIAAVAASVVFLLIMGFSRVYVGAHTITDVLAGYAMGMVVVAAMSGAAEKINGLLRRFEFT